MRIGGWDYVGLEKLEWFMRTGRNYYRLCAFYVMSEERESRLV